MGIDPASSLRSRTELLEDLNNDLKVGTLPPPLSLPLLRLFKGLHMIISMIWGLGFGLFYLNFMGLLGPLILNKATAGENYSLFSLEIHIICTFGVEKMFDG